MDQSQSDARCTAISSSRSRNLHAWNNNCFRLMSRLARGLFEKAGTRVADPQNTLQMGLEGEGQLMHAIRIK
jgi:hypothetical protein